MNKIYIKKNTTSEELLEIMFNDFNIKNRTIYYNEYGKPYIKDKLFFNISNKDNITVLVVSSCEVGVDIDKCHYKKLIANKIISGNEIIYDDLSFTKAWVMKEAYIKMLGIGLSYGMNNVDTTTLKNIELSHYEDYLIAICYQK